MQILAFDTATTACAAAVWKDGHVLAHHREVMVRGQAEALLPMINAVLEEAGLKYFDLNRLAVTSGPGAFTGLRAGLSTARALSLAANIPLVSVSTTEVLAAATDTDERLGRNLLVVVDSKCSDLYAQVFDTNLLPLSKAIALSWEDLPQLLPEKTTPILLAGGITLQAADILTTVGHKVTISQASDTPNPVVLAEIAVQKCPTPYPSPIYLRPAKAKLPKNGGRLRP